MAVTGGVFDITHQYLDDNPTSNILECVHHRGDPDRRRHGYGHGEHDDHHYERCPGHRHALSATSVDENGVVHLTGTYSDMGTQDTHTLTINWGEGSPQTVAVTGGAFDITHQYLDDNPTGTPSNVYTIGVTLTDDDTGTDTGSTTTTITNVPRDRHPGGHIGGRERCGSPDRHVQRHGDPGHAHADDQLGRGSPQTVAVTGGAFDITHQYLDDNPTGTPSNVYTIGVTLTDDDTGTDTGSTTTTITNVAPR